MAGLLLVEQRVGDVVEQVVVDDDASSVGERTIESADDGAWVVEEAYDESGVEQRVGDDVEQVAVDGDESIGWGTND